MKVLVLGATGNLGLRLVPALLTHGHHVVAFVRSSNKLQSALPSSVFQHVTIVEGNATDSKLITRAILDNGCDAIVTAAGVAAIAPWSKSDLPAIFRSVVNGVVEAGKGRKEPLRAWFMGGQTALYYPGTEKMLSDYIPIFLEHRQNLALLKSLPPNTIDWSLLCPQIMTPESSDLSIPAKSSKGKLVASANTPPNWQNVWLRYLPFLGRFLAIALNASRYETTLEQNADFIASDLDSGEGRWVGTAVGVIDASK